MLGGEQNAASISETLLLLQQSGGLEVRKAEECAGLRVRIDHLLSYVFYLLLVCAWLVFFFFFFLFLLYNSAMNRADI